MPTGKGILRQEQEAFPIRLPALAYFNKNDIFTRPLASACNVCVYTKIADSQIFRQENCLCRIGGIASDSRNCIYHIKKLCAILRTIYIYVNNKSKSALGLQLKSVQRYNKKSSWPADKHDFFRPQTKRRRKTRAQKQNCEPSRTELRGLAIFDARARNLRFRPP